jgi:hypothetical protein
MKGREPKPDEFVEDYAMKRLLARCAGLLLGLSGAALAAGIPLADDLARDAARDHRVPVLLFFVAEGCPYCEAVERDYLRPMHNSREYREQVMIRKIDVGASRPLKDFQGRETTHREFARRARATFTPTLRLTDARGADLAEAIIGYNTPALYGGRIARALEDARERLRRVGARCPAAPSAAVC